jgi:hypothetical protein
VTNVVIEGWEQGKWGSYFKTQPILRTVTIPHSSYGAPDLGRRIAEQPAAGQHGSLCKLVHQWYVAARTVPKMETAPIASKIAHYRYFGEDLKLMWEAIFKNMKPRWGSAAAQREAGSSLWHVRYICGLGVREVVRL